MNIFPKMRSAVATIVAAVEPRGERGDRLIGALALGG
jgi:hypothetical protein